MATAEDPPTSNDGWSPWAKVTGPCYDVNQLRVILGRTPAEVAELGRERRLLLLRTVDGHLVAPTFQFKGTEIMPGLAEVLSAIDPTAIDEWTLASFLTGRVEGALEGESIIEWLAQGNDPGPAAEIAREASARWMR
jgi:hypothetical protein